MSGRRSQRSSYADCRNRSGNSPDPDPVDHLRHRGDRVRVRHLRNPDAAADRAARAARADRRRAGIARIPDVGRAPVLHPGVRRRHLRPDRRLHDRSLRPPPGPHLQHPDLRDLGVPLGVRHVDSDAAVPAVPGVHRGVRRVRGRGRVAGRAVPRAEAARESARLHPGVFVPRRAARGHGQRPVRRVCREPAGARGAGFGADPEPACALALHLDVGRPARDPADPDPAVPAGVADLAVEEAGRHAAASQLRGTVLAGAAPHHHRHDGDVRDGLWRRVWRDSADSPDRARPAGGAARWSRGVPPPRRA